MKFSLKSILIASIAAVSAFFIGCSSELANTETTDESLNLQYGFVIQLPGTTSRSAYYTQDDAKTYQIIINHNDAKVYDETAESGASKTVTVDELGTYTITIKAYAENGDQIAEGTTTKDITTKAFEVVTVYLNPELKTVTFTIDVEWTNPEDEAQVEKPVDETTTEIEVPSSESVTVTLTENAYTFTRTYNTDGTLKTLKAVNNEDEYLNYTINYAYSNGTQYVSDILYYNWLGGKASYTTYYANGQVKQYNGAVIDNTSLNYNSASKNINSKYYYIHVTNFSQYYSDGSLNGLTTFYDDHNIDTVTYYSASGKKLYQTKYSDIYKTSDDWYRYYYSDTSSYYFDGLWYVSFSTVKKAILVYYSDLEILNKAYYYADDGNPTGYEEYYSTGVLKAERKYYTNGSRKSYTEYYEDGKVKSVTTYDESGTETGTTTYEDVTEEPSSEAASE